MDIVQQRLEIVNKEVEKIPFIKNLSTQTGVPAAIFLFVPLIILTILVLVDFGASLITSCVGVVYPLFKSI